VSWTDDLLGVPEILADGTVVANSTATGNEPIANTLNFINLAAAWNDAEQRVDVSAPTVAETKAGYAPAHGATAGAVLGVTGGAPTWAKVLNANVDDAAAIAGSKVAPVFGPQQLSSEYGYALAFRSDVNSEAIAGELWTAETTGAVIVNMTRDLDSNAYLSIPTDNAVLLKALVVGLADNGEGVGYESTALLVNDGGTLALVSVSYTPFVREGAGLTAANVGIIADDGNDQLKIQVLGVAGRDIKWRGQIRMVRAGGLP
jgi:hypothetical protein